MDRMRGWAACFVVVGTIGGIWACSSDASDGGATTTNDGGTDGTTTPTDGSVPVPPAPVDAASDAPSLPDGGGVRVNEKNGPSYTLTESAAVVAISGSYKVGAASSDGGVLRSMSLLLQYSIVDGGTQVTKPPIPGTYTCNADGGVIMKATVQYTVPGPAYYQSEPTSDCTVQLTAFGAVGQPVTGTYVANAIPKVGAPATTLDFSGDFSVTRAQ